MRIRGLVVGVFLIGCAPSGVGSREDVGKAHSALIEVPTVSDEIRLQEPPVPTIQENNSPMLGSGGGLHLVVLQDWPNGAWFAHRIADDGSDLDPNGIPLGAGTPRGVAFVGAKFLVEKTDSLDTCVGLDGTTSTPGLGSDYGLDIGPPAASDAGFGRTYLSQLDSQLHVRSYDANGFTQFDVAVGKRAANPSALAFAGGTYWTLVVPCPDYSCSAVQMIGMNATTGDVVMGPTVDTGSRETMQTRFACANGTCALAWTEQVPPPGTCEPYLGARVYLQRFDAATGTSLDTSPTLLIEDAQTELMDADGNGFVVAVMTNTGGRLVRLGNAPGSVVDSFAVAGPSTFDPFSVSYGSPALAFDGTTHLLVRPGSREVVGRILAADATPGVSVAIGAPVRENTQAAPAVSSSGTNYLVAWTDLRGRHQEIGATRVDSTGHVLDDPPILMPRVPTSEPVDRNAPQAAFDGQNYVVVWLEHRIGDAIVGVRISPAGVVLDPTPIDLVASAALGAYSLVSSSKATRLYWTDIGCDGDHPTFRRVDLSPTGGTVPLSSVDIDTVHPWDVFGTTSGDTDVIVEAALDRIARVVVVGPDGATQTLGGPFERGAVLSVAPVSTGVVVSTDETGAMLEKGATTWTARDLSQGPLSCCDRRFVASDTQRLFVVQRAGLHAEAFVIDDGVHREGPHVSFDASDFLYRLATRAPGEALVAYTSSGRVRMRLLGVTSVPDGGAPFVPADGGRDATEAPPDGGRVPTDASVRDASDGGAGAPPMDARSPPDARTIPSGEASTGAGGTAGANGFGGSSPVTDAAVHDAAAAGGAISDMRNRGVGSDGCGCRVADRSQPASEWWLAAWVMLTAVRRARRRSRARGPSPRHPARAPLVASTVSVSNTSSWIPSPACSRARNSPFRRRGALFGGSPGPASAGAETTRPRVRCNGPDVAAAFTAVRTDRTARSPSRCRFPSGTSMCGRAVRDISRAPGTRSHHPGRRRS